MERYGIMTKAVFLSSCFMSVVALPVRPYAQWKLNCNDMQNQTLIHPDFSFREVSKAETWGAVLQNGKSLQESSVRCWCKSDTQYEWDSEELGPGEGWWTFIKHLVVNGDTCTCPPGQAIMVEMDHNTCSGFEAASGFFNSSYDYFYFVSAASLVSPEWVGLTLLGSLALLA